MKPVRSRRTVTAYVSKYLAKVNGREWADPETGEITHTGRCWGLRGHKQLLDQNSYCRLQVADDGADPDTLGQVFADTGLAYGERAEWSAHLGYDVYLPEDAYWLLVERMLRWAIGKNQHVVGQGRHPPPPLVPMGIPG